MPGLGYSAKVAKAAEQGVARTAALFTSTGKTQLPTWNIPAWYTCPGRTGWCSRYCYAMTGRFAWTPVLRGELTRLGLALRPDFPDRAVREIRGRGWSLVRLHGSGDFFLVPMLAAELPPGARRLVEEAAGARLEELPPDIYIRNWAGVIKGLPGVRFYTYTRAWRSPEVWEAIERHLLGLPNLAIYLSVDKSMTPEELRRALELARRHGLRLALTDITPEEFAEKTGERVEAATCPYVRLQLMERAARRAGQAEAARRLAEARRQATCSRCQICPRALANVYFPRH